MNALHQLGGVPPGWQVSPLRGDVAGGRRAFEELGCHSCHKVLGEAFSKSPPSGPGPELTGMGAHHPPGYFLESIINPNAILVEGPGWISAQGLSTMPAYPDLTVTQLEDLVAYISSLTTNDPHAGHVMAGMAPDGEVPAPAAIEGTAFFVQSFEVLPGKVLAFEEWFRREGAPRFLAIDGLLGIETFVDATRPDSRVTSVWSFRDETSLLGFVNSHDDATIAAGTEFDSFVTEHDHKLFRRPPVYRAPGLSTR